MGTMDSSTGYHYPLSVRGRGGLRLRLGGMAMVSLSIAPAPPLFGKDHGLMAGVVMVPGIFSPFNLEGVWIVRHEIELRRVRPLRDVAGGPRPLCFLFPFQIPSVLCSLD